MIAKKQLEEFRNGFSQIDSFANFQWGGYSSKPVRVLEATEKWQRYEGVLPSSPEFHKNVTTQRLILKTKLSELLNCTCEEIALTGHTTAGIDMVAWGLDWIPGDVIVLTKHEHPANILPWYSLAKRFGCKVIFLDALQDDQEMIRQLKSLFSANTCKVMAISHVSRNTGYRLPVEQMCQVAREHNVFSLIDGAQSVGNIAVDFNAIGCDAYTFCGHKWLFGPQGTGALFIAKKSMEKIYPIWVGSKSQISYDFYGNVDWKPTMERYEFGTLATSLESGWLEALVMLSEIGYEQIFETIALVTKRLKHTIIQQGLVDVITPMDTALSSGIFVIDLRGEDEVEFSRYAWSNAKVQVSPLPCKSRIRICNHIVNSASDHEKLLQVVESFMTSKKRKSI